MGKRIIVCGGGTAGHIYPALAIIEEILNSFPETEILYAGTERGMEQKIIKNAGINFKALNAAGILQKASFFKRLASYAKFIFSLVSGILKSLKILRSFKPDCILAMGGYVCAPVLVASIFLRKKIYLHEQNYIPGRLIKFFSKLSNKIFISFRETQKFLAVSEDKIIYSGNPVRKIIRDSKNMQKNYLKYGLSDSGFTVTAFGGSLGSENINNVFLKSAQKIKDRYPSLQFVLISGARFFEKINYEEEKHEFLKVFPYIDEMNEIYNISDLIISRSGANTVAELKILNIPSVLIPYPYAINNHQYYNAKVLEKEKRAFLVNDKDFNEEVLCSILEKLIINDYEFYNRLKENKSFETIDSHKIIADYLCR